MRTLKFIDQKAGRVVASLALLLATVLPTLTPALASAAQLTARSIALDDSTTSAVSDYKVKFTAPGAAGAVILDFCDNTPLIGEACDTPAGFSATAVASSDGDVTSVSDIDSNTVLIETTITAAEQVELDLTTITNPSAAGPLYIRAYTYDTFAHANEDDDGPADGYQDAENIGHDSYVVDTGSVAASITSGIGVTGDVLETMTFCVSGADTINPGCATGVTSPTLEIGEEDGSGVVALSAGALSTANVYTQISTNALSGAVVSLKSSTLDCGGLSRLGGGNNPCGVPATGPAGNAVLGTAGIGIRGATATNETTGGATASGSFVVAGVYDTTNYRLNWVDGDAEGVTGPYGDPFLNTAGGPASNKEMALEFGASISAATAAGRYTAAYSLIATGTF